MRILVTDNTHPILHQLLRQAGHEVVVDTALNYDTLLSVIPQYDALVVRSKTVRFWIMHAICAASGVWAQAWKPSTWSTPKASASVV